MVALSICLTAACSATGPDDSPAVEETGVADMTDRSRADAADQGSDSTDMGANTPDTARPDMGPDADMTVEPQPFTFSLGNGQPFTAWQDGADLPVVAGLQGGFHTEHVAFVDLSLDDATDATIYASVEIDGAEVANGGWIFDRSLWKESGDGLVTSLPVLVFADEPPYNTEAEVIGRIELVDGREESFQVTAVLVPADQGM